MNDSVTNSGPYSPQRTSACRTKKTVAGEHRRSILDPPEVSVPVLQPLFCVRFTRQLHRVSRAAISVDGRVRVADQLADQVLNAALVRRFEPVLHGVYLWIVATVRLFSYQLFHDVKFQYLAKPIS